jgi:hypothetical protein
MYLIISTGIECLILSILPPFIGISHGVALLTSSLGHKPEVLLKYEKNTCSYVYLRVWLYLGFPVNPKIKPSWLKCSWLDR